MTVYEGSPTKPEIKDQLGRMLAAPRFRAAENQADFLELGVERLLQGKKTTEQIVAEALFKGKYKKDESSDVRVTARNLRKTIKKYYEAEGAGDLVLITFPEPSRDRGIKLPEGGAYTPQCSHNPIHEAMKELRLGQYHCLRGTNDDYMLALEHFSNAVKMAPNDARVYVGAAETMCGFHVWDFRREKSRAEGEDSIMSAAKFLDYAHNRAPRFWRVHAVGGVMLMLERDYELAKKCFDTSLALDRESTESFPGYFDFLLGVGNTSEALRLAKKLLDAQPESIFALMVYAKTLIKAGEVADAEAVLERALQVDQGYYEVHLWLALIHIWQQRPGDAIAHLLYVTLHVDLLTLDAIEHMVRRGVARWPEALRSEIRRRFQSGGDFESPERFFDNIKPFSGI